MCFKKVQLCSLYPVPGVTQTDSISVYHTETYSYWPYRTVDGIFSRIIIACFHSAGSGFIYLLRHGYESILQTGMTVSFHQFKEK